MRYFKNRTRYSDHLDVLTALISYMAFMSYWSRTPENLAEELALRKDEVQAALETFTGIFWKRKAADGQEYYTLHARYALRPEPKASKPLDSPDIPKLPPEAMTALLDFVAHRAQAEHTGWNTQLLAIAAIIAAVISLLN
jgi:hypothetical protein